MRFLSSSSLAVAALIAAAVYPRPLRAQDAASGQPSTASQAPAPSSSSATPAPEGARTSPSPSTAAPYGEITGAVKSGNVPLPGVTVSAANSLTGKKYVTSTDVDGSYKIVLAGKGRYVVRAELTAFAPVTQEIVINDQNRTGKAELSMELLSRAQKEAQQQQGQQMAQALAGAGRGAMQQLPLSNSGDVSGPGQGTLDASALAGAGLPNAGLAAEGNTESVAISGAQGRAEENMFDPGEMQDRMAELRDQLRLQGSGSGTVTLNGTTANIQILGGGFGGGGFGGGPMTFVMGGPAFGGGGGRGGRGGRGFNINKPHGSIFYNYGGSILDAAPYSLNGEPVQKATYNQSRFGISMGGPLNIPHIYQGGNKTFLFGNYTGSRGSTAYDQFSNVPTLAERSGDFSALLNSLNPIQLFDPVTHAPILNNQITNINPAAAQLLSFIPQPNLPGTIRNFHFVSSTPSDMDTAFLRFNHRFGSDPGGMFGFGPRAQVRRQQREQSQHSNKEKEKAHWSQSINAGLVYNNVRSTVLNPFPGLGGRQGVHNYNVNFGHSAVKGMFLNSLSFSYNRNNIQTTNNFTNVNNIEGQLGISGASQTPEDFGLPVLNLAPLFNLQDLTPQFRTNQNYSVADSMSLTRGKHSWTWGGNFRHQLADVRNSANARGTFLFTGAATADPSAAGSFTAQQPFADFLLGQAEQTSIQFGAAEYHFRANSFDLFVQDNWRAGKNLTLNLGLRYEFINPMIESNNQLANLDVAPDFSAVALVLPGQIGPITGQKFPNGLINPDRNNFAPRAGIAWKPRNKMVVRAGYGINYNLSEYGVLAPQLGFQPPFATAETNRATSLAPLTLQNGFPVPANASPDHITNSYAVDPNYRLPYVQVWNLNIQQEVSNSLVVNIGYSGSKGTHLDIVRAPDQLPTGEPRFVSCTALTPVTTPCVQPFLFESSEGSSILHSGSVRVRKRMRNGFSVGGSYTYSKSIDDASSIGGGAAVVAQNDLDIAAERGLSSFDQRHRFTADYLYQLPFGKDKKWLTGDNLAEKVFSGIQFSGDMTIASGLPFSPRIFGSGVDLNRGVTGTTRPDLVAGQSIQLSNPTIQEWFNTAAFTQPAGVFGDAGRNIIIGPGTVDFDMAFSKTVQVKEMQSLEFRLSANNVFNHVHFTSIDTTVGSPTFGQVIAAGPMRSAQLTARYRF